MIHNTCQINNDNYIDRDSVLEQILRQERASRQRRRQNFEVNADGNVVCTTLVDYVNE